MGNLMQALKSKNSAAGQGPQFFMDFENAQPSAGQEAEVYAQVDAVLSRATPLLAELRAYEGADAFIRDAISNASNEDKQKAAWDTVCPLVVKLSQYYRFACELVEILPTLLGPICLAEDPLAALESYQALAKQIAHVLDFTLEFDALKMRNSSIQNDFSYYRRVLARAKMTSGGDDGDTVVDSEEANRMALFYAYPTPMLNFVSDAASRFTTQHKEVPPDSTHCTLSTMATICRLMLDSPEMSARFESPETLLFCQRVMVASIVVYDRVHPVGAFAKHNTAIDVKSSIRVLRSQKNPAVEDLMNALKFSTLHLNDEDTPKDIKKLLA